MGVRGGRREGDAEASTPLALPVPRIFVSSRRCRRHPVVVVAAMVVAWLALLILGALALL